MELYLIIPAATVVTVAAGFLGIKYLSPKPHNNQTQSSETTTYSDLPVISVKPSHRESFPKIVHLDSDTNVLGGKGPLNELKRIETDDLSKSESSLTGSYVLHQSNPLSDSMNGSYVILPDTRNEIINQGELPTVISTTAPQSNINDRGLLGINVEFWNLNELERAKLSQRRKYKLAFLELERKTLLEKLNNKPFELANELSKVRKQKLSILEEERKHMVISKKLEEAKEVAKKEAILFEKARRVHFKVEQAKIDKKKATREIATAL